MFVDVCDRILSFFYLCLINQRLFDIRTQQSCAHGSFGLVQYPEQRTTFLFFTHCLYQFQISSCGTVNDYKFAGRIWMDGRNMIQIVFLCLIEIF